MAVQPDSPFLSTLVPTSYAAYRFAVGLPSGMDLMANLKLRPEVQWFAEQMERTLRKNDHKGGWQVDSSGALLTRLKEETEELQAALIQGQDIAPEYSIKEAADVANFAMMLADNARNLRFPTPRIFHPTHSG